MHIRLVKRAAITVTPKQPCISWANAIDEGGVKIGEDFAPEKSVYLIGDASDIIPFERDVIVMTGKTASDGIWGLHNQPT
jgi:hypothetical protein